MSTPWQWRGAKNQQYYAHVPGCGGTTGTHAVGGFHLARKDGRATGRCGRVPGHVVGATCCNCPAAWKRVPRQPGIPAGWEEKEAAR